MTWRDRVRVVPGVPAHLGRTLALSMGLYLLSSIGVHAAGQSLHWGLHVFVGIVWIAFVIWHGAERAHLLRCFWRTMEAMDWEQVARDQGWDPERLLHRHVQIFNETWGRDILRVVPDAHTCSRSEVP